MQYKTTYDGKQIPVLGQGTWGLGGFMQADPSRDEICRGALRAAIELGYTHLDTAEMYGGGHSEELVGQVIRDFPRQDLFIASKVWQITGSPADTQRALEGSLKRLGVDYLDLYLIHRPNHDEPLQACFKALNQAVRDGKVRYLGVSNFNLSQMKTAAALSETPLLTNQVPYNLHNRRYVQNGVLAYCQQHGTLLTAYSPIERGHLASDPMLKEIAGKYGVTPAQVALAWLVGQQGVIALPMSTNRQHLAQNLKALDLQLSAQDRQALDQIELPEESLWPE